MTEQNVLSIDKIKFKIYTIRGVKVILDSDLSDLYEVKTKRLNEQVKRNSERFPSDFMFQLTEFEKNELVAKCDHLKSLKYSYQLPYVFTESGVASLSGILKTKTAIDVNIQVIRAFVSMRKYLSKNAEIFMRLDLVEWKQLDSQIKTDKNFQRVFEAIEDKEIIKKQGIFYDSQIYDAYKFVSDLIRTAKKSIIIIDNYIDDSVFTLLTKRAKNVNVIIYTKNITKQLMLDLDKFNSQYDNIKIKQFNKSHDRFLIIDETYFYHFGASLKDLGKKWFAFSKFNKDVFKLLKRLDLK